MTTLWFDEFFLDSKEVIIGMVSQNWGSDGHFDVINKFKSFWFKGYDTDFVSVFFKSKKVFAFFVSLLFNHLSSTSKWPFEPQFCKRCIHSGQKKWPKMVKKRQQVPTDWGRYSSFLSMFFGSNISIFMMTCWIMLLKFFFYIGTSSINNLFFWSLKFSV